MRWPLQGNTHINFEALAAARKYANSPGLWPKRRVREQMKNQEPSSKIQDLRTKFLIIACLRSKQAFGEMSKHQLQKLSPRLYENHILANVFQKHSTKSKSPELTRGRFPILDSPTTLENLYFFKAFAPEAQPPRRQATNPATTCHH